MGVLADPTSAPELFALRERARRWRFHDHLRTDVDAPARRPGVATHTPVLHPRGDDLAAALLTIELLGDRVRLGQAVERAFPGSTLVLEDDDGVVRAGMSQPGLRRPLGFGELSDGTLGFLLLAAAALAVRPPELLVLNEPETSLHPSLVPAVGALVADAAERSQVVVVTHSRDLVRGLRDAGGVVVELVKSGGETSVVDQGVLDAPSWSWPKR